MSKVARYFRAHWLGELSLSISVFVKVWHFISLLFLCSFLSDRR